MHHLIHSIAAGFAASLTLLVAQETPPAKFEVRCLAFDSTLRLNEAFLHDPLADGSTTAVPIAIKTYLNHQFATLQLKSRKLAITTKPDFASVSRDGELIAEATLPEQTDSAILLLLPGKAGGKARCQVLVVNDAKRAFPAGSYHATNLSAQPVRLTLENKAFDFKPGQIQLIEDPPVRDGNQSGMRTFAFKDNAWKQVSTSLWPHPGLARSLLVIYPNASSGEVEIRAFDDVPPRNPAPVAKSES